MEEEFEKCNSVNEQSQDKSWVNEHCREVRLNSSGKEIANLCTREVETRMLVQKPQYSKLRCKFMMKTCLGSCENKTRKQRKQQ